MCQHRPLGLPALVLALAVAGGVTWWAETMVVAFAARRAEAVSALDVDIKSSTLTLQRAALARADILPLYGSSELYCCGDPYRATQLFGSQPTGFGVFAVGRPGSGSLTIALTLGALGRSLRDRKVVVIDSPPWFFGAGVKRKAFDATFSPEIAEIFIFTAPVSLAVREAVARQLLEYPETLADEPLLRAAVRALADPTALHLAEYHALAPVGWVEAWAKRVRDASRTRQYLVRDPHVNRHPAAHTPAALAWAVLAERGTKMAIHRDTTNPFGFPDSEYTRLLRQGRIQDALARYASGAREPAASDGSDETMATSPEWENLRLTLAILRELGAEPLVLSIPFPGYYDDFTSYSPSFRRAYYDRWERTVDSAGFPWLDFREADEDPYFLTDIGAHFSPRGYVFANRALDMYWHGESIENIRLALDTLRTAVPAPAPPKAVEPGRWKGAE